MIVMAVAQYEHRGNGVVRVSAAQFGGKTRSIKHRLQSCQLLRRCEQEGVHVRCTPDRPVHREREGPNYGVVDVLTLQDFDYIEEQERGLTRPIGPHALNSALRTRCPSAARPAWCRAPSN